MKIKFNFKSPYVVNNALSNSCDQGLDREEVANSVYDFSQKYLLFGEYLTVEYDTETGNVSVIPVK